MEHLNFNRNYNQKLFGNYLTTFRRLESVTEKGLKIEDEVELQFNHIPIATATIKEMETIDLDDIFNETPIHLRMLMTMDIGTFFARAYDTIRHMCGNKVVIILLEVNKLYRNN